MKIIFCAPGTSFSKSFVQCWTSLILYCVQNGIQFSISQPESNNIYMLRNKCLGADTMRGKNQKPFDGKVDYDYLMWIDSDMVFNPQQFQRLLNHNLDIVGGLYAWEGGQGFSCGKWDVEFFKKNGYMPFYTEQSLKEEVEKQKTELLEVDYIGFGFLLVKKGVFEKMEYPWFEPYYTEIDNIKDFSMEDVSFCLKAKALGYKVYLDPLVRVGHEKKAIY